MRLTQLITLVRARVADGLLQHWSDVQIARELNLQQQSLFRRKANAHSTYGARNIDIRYPDDATLIDQLDSDEFVYSLPSWVHRVERVRILNADGTTGSLVDRITGNLRKGWSFHGNRTIVLKGPSTPQSIRLRVQKLPTSMFRGTCVVDASDLSQIVIPIPLALESGATERFDVDAENDAFLGATIEVTSASVNHDPRGVLATVKEQVREFNGALNAYQYVLTVFPRFTDFVKINDTFEIHSEIEDAHANLLVLRTAEALFQSTNNLAAVNVLQGKLMLEEITFNNSIQPREGDAVHIMETEDSEYEVRDLEHDQLTDF